jgi:hypothetical protein
MQRIAVQDIQPGDEFMLNGDEFIATETQRLGGPVGSEATIRVFTLHVQRAGLAEDGTLEFGVVGRGSHDLPGNQDVLLLRSAVRYRTSADYVLPLAPVDRATEKRLAARSELVRVALRRKQQEEAARASDAAFRKGVCDALEAGMSVADIMEETGLSRARIYQIRDGRR